jgi:hypothetical protein
MGCGLWFVGWLTSVVETFTIVGVVVLTRGYMCDQGLMCEMTVAAHACVCNSCVS